MDATNLPLIEEMYEVWRADQSAVPADWRAYFRRIEQDARPVVGSEAAAGVEALTSQLHELKQSRVNSLIWAHREAGYIYADINPLEYRTPDLDYLQMSIEGVVRSIGLEEFGLTDADLDTEFSAGPYLQPPRAPLRDILANVRDTYCGAMGVEIQHIQNRAIRRWLIEKIETNNNRPAWGADLRKGFQQDLIRAEEFERFIQSQFIGQKRFSLEGGEVLIPALRYLVDRAARSGVQEMVFGSAHRGRLNILTNVLAKPYVDIFAAFEDNYKPHVYGGSGDVKYHLGHSSDYTTADGRRMHVSLVANPSHLEAVDPVVQGKARGVQRRRGDVNRKKVVPILIHGDAAFRGQGVVSETFNLYMLRGYKTGGTIHIVVNNQIGFTTASKDARSTFFTTDVAKTCPVPILHVNGDDPDYVVRAIELAFQFRQKFSYDVVVDIMCYRRLGHNEADEPSFTHPLMYKQIENHPSVVQIYGAKLDKAAVVSLREQDDFRTGYVGLLRKELERARAGYAPAATDAYGEGDWRDFRPGYSHERVATAIATRDLQKVGTALTVTPEGFGLHPKLQRFVAARKDALSRGEGIDWAFAESLAFGTLLLDGYHVRLSGEDSARGTFSQRHAVWWDVTADRPRSHVPLNHIESGQSHLSVYDSPLSEFSVLGFDYGYSLAQPKVLVLWEAQFGDFANGAQVIIDQFIVAGESKWQRASGLVMLLPHGYEGQGPEHSSAHLERYLQLCAQDNIQVCYPTTPAQYFHLLRRQMKRLFRKPLIVMTPKSLLRHKQAVSRTAELTGGFFQDVLDDPARPADARTLLLCTGKVYYDLAHHREADGRNDAAIVRLEQLYPFPEEQLVAVLAGYAACERVVWVQEEPRNRGAWTFARERIQPLLGGKPLEYAGRPEGASPATGSHRQHEAELESLVSAAFSSKPSAGPKKGATRAHRG
jgi:2-oxoglutarate dehydrogenase E1 component